MTQPAEDNARDLQELGQTTFDALKEMVDELTSAEEKEDDEAREEAEQHIHEDPLSVEVRSDWHAPGEDGNAPTEFKILLSWGGPATQLVGELNEHGEPEKAWIETQDWFLPWTKWNKSEMTDNQAILLRYASCFYFTTN